MSELTTENLRAAWQRSIIPMIADESLVLAAMYARAEPEVQGRLVICHFDKKHEWVRMVAAELPNLAVVERIVSELAEVPVHVRTNTSEYGRNA